MHPRIPAIQQYEKVGNIETFGLNIGGIYE